MMINLATKYRPKTFKEYGNYAFCEIIENKISQDAFPNVMLLTGHHGTGKTTLARICASEFVNSQKELVFTGSHVDVIEINCADKNGVDDIRDIIAKAKIIPGFSKYKFYILDEAHILTMQAQNALLKILEEPPKHCKFILCTTDPSKIIPTVRSRCQHIVIPKPENNQIFTFLSNICKLENITYEDSALETLINYADYSYRNASNLLEQLSEQGITKDTLIKYLGIPDRQLSIDILIAISKKDRKKLLELLYDYGKVSSNWQALISSICEVLINETSNRINNNKSILSGKEIMEISRSLKSIGLESKSYLPIQFVIQTNLLLTIEKI